MTNDVEEVVGVILMIGDEVGLLPPVVTVQPGLSEGVNACCVPPLGTYSLGVTVILWVAAVNETIG